MYPNEANQAELMKKFMNGDILGDTQKMLEMISQAVPKCSLCHEPKNPQELERIFVSDELGILKICKDCIMKAVVFYARQLYNPKSE